MLAALDSKQDGVIAYKALRKQIEVILELIDEKRKELKIKDNWKAARWTALDFLAYQI